MRRGWAMVDLDIEHYIEQLKENGIDTVEAEERLQQIISSTASTRPPKVQ